MVIRTMSTSRLRRADRDGRAFSTVEGSAVTVELFPSGARVARIGTQTAHPRLDQPTLRGRAGRSRLTIVSLS